MTTRKYSSRSQQTTLTGAITSGATSMTVVSGTALLGGVTISAGTTFTLVLDVDTALEEIVDATAVSTNTFTITRAIDGSTAQDHSAGAVVRHMAIGRDYRDANTHTEADAYYNDGAGAGHTMHGIGSGEGVVVGTLKTQTLTNKTLTSPTISNPTITGTSGVETSIVFEGSTADAYETTLTVVDPTQDNTITLPNTTGTVVIADATQTLTNKTLTSPTISGSPVITGLSSAGMISSSATPKDYVDSILGSATAAATSAASAATSAASAATSATSASNSATASATSASAAATSATAAATSATSAAASATAAATSATSAAASATAASTSEANAATSATSASNSASAAATSATSAAASATAAATSATSAAASATAAATSASSAATSASSAATSYDQFDDRYLGDKSSDPTVDNDGNPLLTGALYYNTVLSAMKVYSGSAWQLVAPDTSNFVDKATWTGKGTIVSATAASTPSALTVASTNGYILAVNSATSTGLEWVAPNPGDITSVTAGTGLSGGGTSGDVTLSIDSTVATLTGTQALSNKTLTAPRFATAGEIDDANGNELIKFPVTVVSAINEITVSNAAIGETPSISATGDDTNISLNLVAKGTGTVQIGGVNAVTTTGTTTLTNKTISGANNTITDIGNASLTNSSITINGTSVSLGGSATVTSDPNPQIFMLMGA